MTKRKSPDTFRPAKQGSSERGAYEPEPPIRAPREPDAKPQLVGESESCREVLETIAGRKKYCPYEREPGSEYCKKHQR